MPPKGFVSQVLWVPYHTCVCAVFHLAFMTDFDIFRDGISHTFPGSSQHRVLLPDGSLQGIGGSGGTD